MRMLLSSSLAAADDAPVLERADCAPSIVPRRVLLVERVLCCSRRAIRPRFLRYWLMRLLPAHSFAAANILADRDAYISAVSSTDGRTDEHADGGADNAPDRTADVNADISAISRNVHDRNRSPNGRMRSARRQLLYV